MNNKGMVFNWIFILIAGAAVLLIASVFLVQYYSLTQERARIDTLKQFDNALGNLATTPGVFVKTIEFAKKMEIETGCESITLNGKSFSFDHILFGPEKLEGRKFKLGHAQISGVDVYYLVDSKSIPHFSDSRSKDIIKPLDGFVQAGSGLVVDDEVINFVDGPVSYISDEDLVGGIIVGDSDKFSCLQRRIFEETGERISILKAKARILQREFEGCIYNPIISSFNLLEDAASRGDASAFGIEQEKLENKEKMLGGCPNVQ